jgi:rhodanese-related sulfurtransferase
MDITIDEFNELENVYLVDVREPHEFADGHIPGAVNIPLRTLFDKMRDGEFHVPAGKILVFSCRTGGRSSHAVAHADHYDIDAKNLKGGYVLWLKSQRE